MTRPRFNRILLKLSGEALMGDDPFGINRATIVRMVEEIAEVVHMGVQVAVVIGRGGSRLREVGTNARKGIEALPRLRLIIERRLQDVGRRILAPHEAEQDPHSRGRSRDRRDDALRSDQGAHQLPP